MLGPDEAASIPWRSPFHPMFRSHYAIEIALFSRTDLGDGRRAARDLLTHGRFSIMQVP
jgi:hypothetical protein